MVDLLGKLPSDLLTCLLSYLDQKDICSLDTAILNHDQRPIFLECLANRFSKGVWIWVEPSQNAKIHWYLCRNIPIRDLNVGSTTCPIDILSANCDRLKDISFWESTIDVQGMTALSKCSSLEDLDFFGCNIPYEFDLGLLFQNLSNLRQFTINDSAISFPISVISSLARNCPSLTSFELSALLHFGDKEVECLVNECLSLQSVSFESVDITQNSIALLMKHSSRIKSIGVTGCQFIDWNDEYLLLKEITIPQMINLEEENLQIIAIRNFTKIFLYHHHSLLREIFSDGLIDQLAHFLSFSNRKLTTSLLRFFDQLCQYNFYSFVMNAGVVPHLVKILHSKTTHLYGPCLEILKMLSSHDDTHHHLLLSGVLQTFHTPPQNLSPFQGSQAIALLRNLSYLIPLILIPHEEWIKTLPFLILSSDHSQKNNQSDIAVVISSICMSSSCPSHVTSLVNYGIINYWRNILQNETKTDETKTEIDPSSSRLWITGHISSY